MLLKTSPKTQSIALILLITLTLPYCQILAADEQSQQEPQTSISNTLFTPAIIASFAFFLWITAPDEVKDNLINQLTPKMLATNFATEYSSWALTTLCHEGGHALVQSWATGRPSDIHFGASTSTNKPPLFSLGRLHIDGLKPTYGHTPHIFVTQEQKEELIAMVREAYRKPKEAPQGIDLGAVPTKRIEFQDLTNPFLPDRRLYALFLIAGGLSGLLAHHAAQKLFSQPLRIDGITINQLCNILLPMDKNSDGAALWRDCVGVSPAVINRIIEIAPLFEIAGEMYVAFHDPRSQNSPIRSKLLIGIINYLTRGYLRFHV